MIVVFLSLILLGGALPVYAEAANTSCPVMPGEKTKEKFFVDYQGKRILFCCRHCVKKFKNRPEKYMARVRAN